MANSRLRSIFRPTVSDHHAHAERDVADEPDQRRVGLGGMRPRTSAALAVALASAQPGHPICRNVRSDVHAAQKPARASFA